MGFERPSQGTPDLQNVEETPEITHVPTDIEVVNEALEKIHTEDIEENERQERIQQIIDGEQPTEGPNKLPPHPTLQ